MDPQAKHSWKRQLENDQSVGKWSVALSQYIDRLDAENVPVVFELSHFARLVGLQPEIVASAVSNSDKFYRTFEIPKRSGEMRTISAPYPSLLRMQRWIYGKILSEVRISQCSHGFVKEKSVITNARTHLGNREILKMDIEDFFPSISMKRVIAVFRFLGYSPKVSYILGSLCTTGNHLPQGGAASPALSNIIATPLDRRLGALALTYGYKYTRYADDLAFSGNHISLNFIDVVKTIIASEGFRANNRKTKLIRHGGRRILTGISIGSGQLRLPKKTRRDIRQRVFYLEKNGILEESSKTGEFDPLYVDRVLGKLLFWRQIEPENYYVVEKIGKIRELILAV